jgi:rifampicin phosphotransferase
VISLTPTPLIVRSSAIAASTPAGGKARALAAAERAGLPVPRWFAVLPAAFTTERFSEHFRSELTAAIEALHADSPADAPEDSHADSSTNRARLTVAVRSSASDEDGSAHSFAGQLESYLFVAPADVEARIRDVWRSGLGERVVEYRRHHGLSLPPPVPAVIVQCMVIPRAAGVAFAADPVSGRRGIAVVSAVSGSGEDLVSGKRDADTWQVDRTNAIILRALAGGSADGATAASLADREVIAVARLARDASRHFGRPQDIEWAIAESGATLYLLQSRPITTLAHTADPDAELAIWDNSNIVESYSGVTTPLTFSFASEIYQGVYRQFCRLMGVSDRVVAAEDDTFRNMLGLIRGRLYYNLLNWYRVLALLPGFTVNRRFMEQMMGVRESLPESVKVTVTSSAQRGKFLDALALARTLIGLFLNYLRLPRQISLFTDRLNDALAPPPIALTDQRPDELASAYRDLRRKLLTRWDAPLVNDFFAMIFYGVLRQLTARWCDDKEGTLQNDLVGGDGGMVSAEPAQRMQAMARMAAAHPALAAQLRMPLATDTVARASGSATQASGTTAATAATAAAAAASSRDAIEMMKTAIDAVPEFRVLVDGYLDKFGERCVNELKLESETLHDDPLPLLRAVGHLAAQPAALSADTQAGTLRALARERTHRALAGHPLRRLVFHWVLRNARSRVRDRENLRLERTRLFGRVRRIFVEMGQRLNAVDLLDEPRDIFYLEVDEVLAFVEGRATTTDLRALVRVRRAEFSAYADRADRDDAGSAPAPADRFETRGMPYQGHDFQRPAVSTSRASADASPASGGGATVDSNDDARQGLGCCPGIVRGPVRVVFDPRTVPLDQRAILVAEHTDPGWIMIFPSATGVLVERGSLLSHAAIVARELGIPAIVSVPGITRWLRDGDWVEMDGATGRVRRIPAEASDAE